MILYIIGGLIVAGLVVLAFFLSLIWRVVVPTNQVHIVQSSKQTVSYGRGREAGNTYYKIPSSIPKFGVTVTAFPESVFDIYLKDYEAYDTGRLPFVVDVQAFFRISDSQVAAQRVANFNELQNQLKGVLQGAIRGILANDKLENILQDRATLGEKFTKEVDANLKEWGVGTVKMIEFMDIRDSGGSRVIANMMEKEKSRIEKESRVTVAANMQEAETKEIEAKRQVDLSRTEAQQQVGIRQAEAEKQVGISKQKAEQEVQAEAKITTERLMEVRKVQNVKDAEIQRDVAIVKAEQDQKVQVVEAEAQRDSTIRIAEGKLEATKKDAEGIAVVGQAKADAEKAILLAPVNAQITLATEIGENEGYQNYLITIRQVEAQEAIGKEMAGAIKAADLKIIANGGTINEGMSSITSMFTPTGGTNLAGMIEALSQTDQGKQVVEAVTKKLGSK